MCVSEYNTYIYSDPKRTMGNRYEAWTVRYVSLSSVHARPVSVCSCGQCMIEVRVQHVRDFEESRSPESRGGDQRVSRACARVYCGNLRGLRLI